GAGNANIHGVIRLQAYRPCDVRFDATVYRCPCLAQGQWRSGTVMAQHLDPGCHDRKRVKHSRLTGCGAYLPSFCCRAGPYCRATDVRSFTMVVAQLPLDSDRQTRMCCWILSQGLMGEAALTMSTFSAMAVKRPSRVGSALCRFRRATARFISLTRVSVGELAIWLRICAVM